jgi:hypothetical protein
MLDPLTSLSIASSIVQLADFGARVTKDILDRARSVDGYTTAGLHYDSLATGLAERSLKIQQSLQPVDQSKSLSKDDQALQLLAVRCTNAAKELSSLVESLKETEESGKWTTFRKACLSVWREKDIAALARKLESVRADLDSHILLDIRLVVKLCP